MEYNNLDIKIRQFLEGKMSSPESAAFKKEMAEDETLAEAVGLARIERLMQAQLLDNYMESKLAEWQGEDDLAPPQGDAGTPQPAPPGGKTGTNNRYWLLLLFPLLAAGVWWFLRPVTVPEQTASPSSEIPPANGTDAPRTLETPTPAQPEEQVPANGGKTESPPSKPAPKKDIPIAQKGPTDAELLAVVEEYDIIEAEPIPHGFRGAADELAQAEKERLAGNFDAAVSIYKKVATENTTLELEASWNLGLLYFGQKQFREALPYLKTAADNEDFLYRGDARYLIVLCNVAARNFSEAERLLDGLVEDDYFDGTAEKTKAMQLKNRVAGLK